MLVLKKMEGKKRAINSIILCVQFSDWRPFPLSPLILLPCELVVKAVAVPVFAWRFDRHSEAPLRFH